MEVTSRELEVCSSRNPSKIENFRTVSSSKHTGYDRDRHFGKMLLKDSEALGSRNMLVNCSRSKVSGHSTKGKEILQKHIGFEELNDRLKILEEDNESMKQAYIQVMVEREKLVNKIYEDFQKLQHCRNQVIGLKFSDESPSVNPSNRAVMGNGLCQVLCEASNPRILTRDHRANLHFQ